MSLKNGLIDLRSDTVTHPTPTMVKAMASAELGDDVYDEDPTVNRLQERAAALTGHRAALFVASGTMGNLIALLTHGGRGCEVIAGAQSHIYLNEAGGMAALGGMQAAPVPVQADGTLRLEDIRGAMRDVTDVHHPRTRLVCLENTQNQSGGVPLTAAYTRQVAELAHNHGLRLHIDGARIFNAAVALDVDVAELTSPADSVMFCLSKGLSAPVGSLLCGSSEFIAEAKWYRKMVGGGMRQVGVLAASGLVALDEMVERMDDDHLHARRLADGLRGIPGLTLRPDPPSTNMVYFSLHPPVTISPPDLVRRMRERGILISGPEGGRYRWVTHAWVDAADVDKAAAVLRDVLK